MVEIWNEIYCYNCISICNGKYREYETDEEAKIAFETLSGYFCLDCNHNLRYHSDDMNRHFKRKLKLK